MEDIIWRPIKGYEGCYEINQHGDVRSIPRVIIPNGGFAKACYVRGKILKPIYKHGYKLVRLTIHSRHRNYHVHHLLAEAFIPNPDNKPFVDHINTNPLDNRLENLRWVTQAENLANPLSKAKMIEKLRTKEVQEKIFASRIANKGKRAQRPVYCYTKSGAFVRSYRSMSEAARDNHIAIGTLQAALDRSHRTANSLIWSTSFLSDYRYTGNRTR